MPRSSSVLPVPPPFDPECGAVLAQLGDAIPTLVTMDEVVRHMRSLNLPEFEVRPEQLTREGTFEVEDRLVPGPAGAPDISLLICRPSNVPTPTPAIYFIHGGGMVAGDNRNGVLEALDWADEFGAAVVSVEYRLAPETRHPGPVEDCYAGLLWVESHAAELGIDPERILITGSSAGGGLAAAVALMARDRNGPHLIGQLLECPMLDDRNDSVSAVQMAGRGVWDRASNEGGWTALLGDARGALDVSPYAAPARETDYANLPPTFIDVGSAETFRDEAVAYASAIWAAGGIAELHVWPGGFHGYSGLAPEARVSQDTVAARWNWLNRILAP